MVNGSYERNRRRPPVRSTETRSSHCARSVKTRYILGSEEVIHTSVYYFCMAPTLLMATLRSGWDGLLPLIWEVSETPFLAKTRKHIRSFSEETRDDMSPRETKDDQSRVRAHACRKACAN
ncbi:hypothetical protein XU18_4794 [Perkinsela sp. CCAP 1560/4]|nr:hypothetical protein XU18_4794 [Perkinsela sp. CCAP 1560/4]|eukprot:KNH03905.1 hypothetical protein XU18_4794 [Perkinsela sp. CCAP 1560/4]